jgi:two-component system NtrC family sensor kinase
MITLNPSFDVLDKPTHCAEILILDDEGSISELLGEMVEILGYSATLCNLPKHAIEILRERSFDVILSDFRMPGMNGQQFYEAVCQIQPEMARRIVFLTGDVVNPDTVAFLRRIGNRHLSKPFQLTNVEVVLDQMLNSDRFVMQ